MAHTHEWIEHHRINPDESARQLSEVGEDGETILLENADGSPKMGRKRYAADEGRIVFYCEGCGETKTAELTEAAQ